MKLYFNKALNKLFASVPGEGNWELPNANQLEGLSSGGLTPVELDHTDDAGGGNTILTTGHHYIIDMSGEGSADSVFNLEAGAAESIIGVTVIGSSLQTPANSYFVNLDTNGIDKIWMYETSYDDIDVGENASTVFLMWDTTRGWVANLTDLYTPSTWGGDLSVTGSIISRAGNGYLGQATAPTITVDSPEVIRIAAPASAITVTLPSTDIKAGKQYTLLVNGATTTNTVTLDSSDSDAIDVIKGTGRIKVIALQDMPTDATHWEVIELYDTGLVPGLDFGTGTYGTTGLQTSTLDSSYVRNGQHVIVDFHTTQNHHTSMGGTLLIRGLPFTVNNNGALHGVMRNTGGSYSVTGGTAEFCMLSYSSASWPVTAHVTPQGVSPATSTWKGSFSYITTD